MRRSSWQLWLVGSASLASLALPSAGGSAAPLRHSAGGTISITDRQVSLQRIDEGPPGASAGDLEIVWQALYNKRIKPQAIGHAQLICTMLTLHSRNCSATYFLPKGKLVVAGVIGSRLLYEIPITGGTGIYAGARGSLLVTRASEHPQREILQFRLVS